MPNGIDVRKFHTFKHEKHDQCDFLYVGRLVPGKNLHAFLDLVAIIKNWVPRLRVAMIGDGPLRQELENTSTKLGSRDTVSFVGWRDPGQFLSSSKLYVTTTLAEGLPESVLQAMAAGIPCVVPNIDDIPDAAHDGVNSLVVSQPNGIQSFARCIHRERYNHCSAGHNDL